MEITNIHPSSYELASVYPGDEVYIDRDYTLLSIPSHLSGDPWIKPANDDKLSEGDSFVTFDVNQEVDVYVARDVRLSDLPSWMADWQSEGEIISYDGYFDEPSEHMLYHKRFPAGTVHLGGNYGNSTSSMYFIIIHGDADDVVASPSEELALVTDFSDWQSKDVGMEQVIITPPSVSCGDGVCDDTNETPDSCPADCPPLFVGKDYLSISPDDPHYFVGPDGEPVFFLGHHDFGGWWKGKKWPNVREDLKSTILTNHLTFAKIALSLGGPTADNDLWVYKRTGPGTANDGGPKYDLM
ncbi:MAG: hypothetical protein GXP63_05595, partial [DPANN group archaeon]|nr:hypothetical protein [DPANN group archaeon]